ncbi:aromatic acid exporter family protein [Agromyces sp. MMS24-JH15]|uniref:FUSC family protein n=1 Tax=Agromyces sp. MMS24-JH15 TaxID=3243765 RepID=UPI0037489AA7
MGLADAIRASKRPSLLQVGKAAIATVAAWVAADWVIDDQLPVFAAIAAMLVVQPSVNQSLGKAIERSIGVVGGVLVATVLSLAFGDQGWVVILAIVVSMGLAWAMRMTAGTANQVAISAMLVLALGSDSPSYAFARVVETVIGAAIGIVVNVLIVPPLPLAPARRDLQLLGGELAASLDRLAGALVGTRTPGQLAGLMVEARLLRPMLASAEASILAAEESLMLNPRRSAHRQDLADQRALLERLSPIVTQVIGMTRALVDRYDPTIVEEPTAAAIAEQLRRASHDVRLAAHLADVEPDPPTSVIPALTSHLVVPSPKSNHWILIGSLLEDLRRIHEELADLE